MKTAKKGDWACLHEPNFGGKIFQINGAFSSPYTDERTYLCGGRWVLAKDCYVIPYDDMPWLEADPANDETEQDNELYVMPSIIKEGNHNWGIVPAAVRNRAQTIPD